MMQIVHAALFDTMVVALNFLCAVKRMAHMHQQLFHVYGAVVACILLERRLASMHLQCRACTCSH